MNTLKILRVFFRLKGKEFIEMKVHIWGLVLMLSLFLIFFIAHFNVLKNFLLVMAPFIWGSWLLYGLFLFIRFIRSNWRKAKNIVNKQG